MTARALARLLADLLTDRVARARRPGSLPRRAGPALAVLAAGAAIAAALLATAPVVTPPAVAEKVWAVAARTVVPVDLAPEFQSIGRVEARNAAGIAAEVSAEVVRVAVREGDRVRAGDLLVELDGTRLRFERAELAAAVAIEAARLQSLHTEQARIEAVLAEQEAMSRLAAARLDRHRELLARGMIARALLDDVEAQAATQAIALAASRAARDDLPNRIAGQHARLDGARARRDRADWELARTRIVAPFDGPVLAVTVAAGDRVTALSGTLVEIAAERAMEARTPIPEQYRQRIRAHLDAGRTVRARAAIDGAEVDLVLERLGRNVRHGHSGVDGFFVTAIEGAATDDATTAGTPRDDARAPAGGDPAGDRPLPAAGLALASGRAIELTIELPVEADVIAVPMEAVYDSRRVYRIDAGRLVAVEVERVGEHRAADGRAEVLVRSADLAAGATVLTTRLPQAMAGLRVDAGGAAPAVARPQSGSGPVSAPGAVERAATAARRDAASAAGSEA